ncbi:hypothetical protein H0H92_010514 [Tricholoma furcatifolium]|nr:hypothetical protein H0H92_010514 [Tricholoma furcatifolium]
MDDQNLLEILQAHGQNFLNSFSLPTPISESKKRKRNDDVSTSSEAPKVDISYSDEEEWGGITEAYDSNAEDAGKDSSDFEQEDDQFIASSACPNSQVIVFQDIASTAKSDRAGKHQRKAFMSSKVSRLRQDLHEVVEEKKPQEEEEERTNVQNDALLHRLVHTKLLSGSLNPNLDMTSAQRRKALAGRVLELSGAAKLGKGEKSVRNQERNKASKRVRDGLKEKQKQRAKQDLEEAKDLGNYHPTLKKLFGDSDTPSIRKREKGLKMGVGKFRGGFLQLGQNDLDKLNGTGAHRGYSSRGSAGRRK